MVKACGFTKATMYSLDNLMKEAFKRGLTREKVKYCNSVPFKDVMTAQNFRLIGVASIGMLCQTMVFDSITDEL